MSFKSHSAAVFITAFLPLATASAGIKYQDNDRYLEVGGYIQPLYLYSNPSQGASTDDLFFRNLRPYIEGSAHKDWMGKIEFELGNAKDNNEIAVKDAFFQYKGISNFQVAIGNKTFPFSRERLNSSKYHQLVAPTFVGDFNYGTPDHQLGIHFNGKGGELFKWGFAVVQAGLNPDNKKLDFNSLASRNSNSNQGWMLGGRMEFGNVGFSQTNFKRTTGYGIGIGAFNWVNDEDNIDTSNGSASPVDNISGIELAAALRISGLSADIQYNLFNADLMDLDAGTVLKQGIYNSKGETTLENFSIEGGFLFPKNAHEIVLGYEIQDADGYADAWSRVSAGYNYYFSRSHDIKLQLTYRISADKDGITDNDVDEIFLLGQYVF